MFTDKTINGIGRLFRLGSKMKILPFVWNYRSNRVEIGSRKQRIVMILIILYMYFEAAYQTYRLVTGYQDKSVPLPKYMQLFSQFATRLTALVMQTLGLLHCEDIKYFANQLLNMNDGFLEIYGRNHVRDPCAKICAFWYWFVTIHPMTTAAIYAMENNEDRYWHGTLLPTGIRPFFVPLFILVEYWISVFSELGCASMGCIMLAYYKATPVWMIELVTMARESQTKCEQAISLYRANLIMNRAFNNAFSLVLSSGAFALLVDLIIALTCSFRVTGTTTGLSGLQFPIASLGLFLAIESAIRPAADLTIPSNEFLASLFQCLSARRSGHKRRGNVANMEKERKKFMKMRRRCKAITSKGLVSVHAVVGHRSTNNPVPKAPRSHWDEALQQIHVGKNHVESHSQAAGRHQGPRKRANEDRIEVIRTHEEDMPTVVLSPEKKHSLMLKATAKSMYPMVVNCFIFFEFEHSTIFSFYSTVLDQTISALLVT